MDLGVSTEEADFREEVQTWLREHVPRQPRPIGGPEMRAFDVEWQRTIHDAGYAGLTWPRRYGGAERGLTALMTWYEEYALAKGPYNGCCFVGLSHAGPT